MYLKYNFNNCIVPNSKLSELISYPSPLNVPRGEAEPALFFCLNSFPNIYIMLSVWCVAGNLSISRAWSSAGCTIAASINARALGMDINAIMSMASFN